MKRTLIVTAIATSIVAGSAGIAQAGPADGADKRLQQEIAEYEEYERTPAWQIIPDCCETSESWGYADAILGITLVVGLVVLW